eukprot:Platyproteum_vivax@DN2834_c0_g1_i2.p1
MFGKYILHRVSTARHFSTLVIVEQSRNGIMSLTWRAAFNAAKKIGVEPIRVLVTGVGSSTAVQELHIDAPKMYCNTNLWSADAMVEVVDSVLEDATHVVTVQSSFSKDFLPRLGAKKDSQPITDVVKIVDAKTFVRPMYANNALHTVESQDRLKLVSVRASSFSDEVPETMGGETTPVEVNCEALVETVSEETGGSDLPQLGSSKTVVAGGRGCRSKQEMHDLLMPLCWKLNAAMGASRAAVDAG